jgi:hypothetical protein
LQRQKNCIKNISKKTRKEIESKKEIREIIQSKKLRKN